MAKNNRQAGAVYEQKAAGYLAGKGYRILEQNFYSRFGEIDIIAKDGRYLVFIEVKYRRDTSCGDPLEAETAKKQKKICRAAFCYCGKNGYGDRVPCRFDVVAITGGEDGITHIKNAFDFQM